MLLWAVWDTLNITIKENKKMMKPSYWLNDKDDEVQVRYLNSEGTKIMEEKGWLQITLEEFERYERVFLRFADINA